MKLITGIKKMNKMFVFNNVDSIPEIAEISIIGNSHKLTYSALLSLPFSMDFSLLTPDISAYANTYIVLKSASGKGFSPNMILKSGNLVYDFVLVDENIMLIPVNLPVGNFRFTLNDGATTESFDVCVLQNFEYNATESVTVSGVYYFPFYKGLERYTVVTGTGLSLVDTVEIDGVGIDFVSVGDTVLVYKNTYSSTGSKAVELKVLDSVDHSYTVSVVYSAETSDVFYHYNTGSLVYVYSDLTTQKILFYDESAVSYVAAYELDSVSAVDGSGVFQYVVRNVSGSIVPFTAYQITAPNFTLNGFADAQGVIRIQLSLLPDVFTLSFIAYDLGFLSQTFSKR